MLATATTLAAVQQDLIAAFSGDPVCEYIVTHGPRHAFDVRQVISRIPKDGAVLDLGAYPFVVAETIARMGYVVTAAGLWPRTVPLSFPAVEIDCDRAPLPFSDNSFDAVIFTEIFEHLYANPLGAIEEIHRVLKPGGLLYMTTPNGIAVRAIAKMLLRGQIADDVYGVLCGIRDEQMIGHFREYTPKEITRIVEESGFSEIGTTTVNPYRKRKRLIESWFWRAASAPFPKGREVIVSIAWK